ncbi:uncharacterized protein LACBIDRAFT_300761 [Laccaria bicolor S238N-H82]|uniref:Ribosome biogenesis protein SLX9 n=1 Tax=Laccaria bicolor (strain S238N-H82 / ATCC MYA-4686) TaxID=486041 RepID=B0CQG6_LACBS|nr:uncharacterized protein LACBIDRAFT_300761 [Laccaria bicolor S238N-H82]EDR15640.1 predicted protein [Laccaria bicolor S238N-H82]|eukprot:XP_001873848.1 predicted protein [Laccaria bicolor S238N-H82]
MPKERPSRATRHQPSVQLSKRKYAVQENAVKPVTVGTAADVPGDEILQLMVSPDPATSQVLSKKDKQNLRREAFLQKFGQANSPYSKSHNRRLKRKAKEQIAGGLSQMQTAIAALEKDDDPTKQPTEVDQSAGGPKAKRNTKRSMIGEGKGSTLSKSQRKRALELERLRHPLILQNPEFSSSPFETIRIHAQNTLLQHQVPELNVDA